ncbi:MAG: hypothetical protein WAO91_00740 [Candidatus Nitrosotenuis sp.]
MKKQTLVLCLVLFVAGMHVADAQTVQITTGKKTYNYGDYLQITISVSEMTENTAVMYIIDGAGTKSTAIPVVIQNLITTITSPNQFNSAIFKEGKYTIQVQYAGTSASTEFELVDAGNTVLPFGSDVVIPQWADGSISDYGLLKFLVDKNIVALPEGKTLKQSAKIPSWYKKNASWWAEKKITDEEFAAGLGYLLSRQVIVLSI